jgi:two-component system alkaline phosphatase synthesis response regulator PhoP
MPEKILIIDDEENIVLLAETNLEMCGYRVITAQDGKQGLEMAQKEKPDLIILDIRLPEIDGWEVCRRLKNSTDTRNIPIVFLTAHAQENDINKGLSLGAEEFITKPFIPEDMAQRIKKILAQKQDKKR